MNLKQKDVSTRNWVDSAQDRDYWRALVALILRVHNSCNWRVYLFLFLRKQMDPLFLEF